MQAAPGRTMIKVASIVLIVLSGLGLVSVVMAIASIGTLDSVPRHSLSSQAAAYLDSIVEYIYVASAVAIASSAVNLILAILCLRSSAEIEKGKQVQTMAIVLALVAVASAVISSVQTAMTMGDATIGVVSGVFGVVVNLILPAVIFFGARRNTRAAKQPPASD